MPEKIEKALEQVINWGLITLTFLLPFFFLPLTTDFYEFNKNILLIVVSLVLVVAWGGKMVLEKRVSFRRSAFDLPILLLATSYLLSTILMTSNKIENLLVPGGTGTILALTLLYFVMTNNLTTSTIRRLINTLILSGTILALITIVQFIGLGAMLAPAEWMKPKFWSPAGNPLSLVTLLLIILTLAASQIWGELKNKKPLFSASLLSCYLVILLIVIGGGTTVFQLLTTLKPILLPYSVGWQVAVDTFKNSPLLGVGPANFLNAFTASKPLSFNLSDLWSALFGISSNWYFQLLTTVGVLGLGAFLLLIWKVARTKNRPTFLFLPLLVIFIVLAFLPANLLLLTLLYLLVAGVALESTRQYSEASQILPWVIFMPITFLALAAFYFVGRAYAAEFYFKQSIDALRQNQGTKAYNLQIQTIILNPYQSLYRTVYSQTNFALANAIATPPASGLSDQDRQNISILIQQAIREAKAAVTINPNAPNWENLALIYRRLINFAQGADQWAIATYQQAIALDPFNPSLRIALGGIYYGLQNWDEAIKLFEQAVALKPNLPNAHYNLSAAYREKGNFEKAVIAMENTLSLVPKDSDDYQKAQGELEALKKRLAEQAEKEGKKPSESLTPPEPLPTGLKPPLSLPTGSAPEINPTPTAQVTPTF